MKNFIKLTVFLASFISVCAYSDKSSVSDIVKNMDELPVPSSSSMSLTLELIDNGGTTRTRKTRAFSKLHEDKDMMIMYFDTPANVKGTAYLSHNYADDERDDDSWLYLPAMRRSKRVAGGGEADSFMGSDFSYADINGIELKNWDFSMVEDSVEVDGHDCWVLEGVPVTNKRDELIEETGYSKRRIWVRKDNFFVVRAELTLERSKRVKYLKVEGLHQIDNFWVAKRIFMVTTKGGDVIHESRMHFSDVKFDIPLDDSIFMVTQLGKDTSG